jgi:hypothetical protein
MAFFDLIAEAVKGLPVADILRQQLVFADNQFAASEKEVARLQIQNGKLEAQLEYEKQVHEECRLQFDRFKQAHAEEIIICRAVEFRRGKRTGGLWVAFCSKCHCPASGDSSMTGRLGCSDYKCTWTAAFAAQDLPSVLASLA